MAQDITILVVEDDPILKNLLGRTFSGTYHVFFASNGKEALAILKEHTPSIILLDIMMPDMDGFTFMEQVNTHPEIAEKHVPIMIVSNLGQQKDVEHAKELGAKEYLVKAEVSVEEIVAKIQEMLSTGQSTTGQPTSSADNGSVESAQPQSQDTAPMQSPEQSI
ncbi:MAG TPA: response regulator [Candidatus Kaiserbacteria bacterium]|nr:response regulator [Candidatus Kaiserbacteria bacterium]